jgi:hypothetical protein
MVKGLPTLIVSTPLCESCIIAKHQRDSFPRASYRAKDRLEIVHTDICGPMQTESIGGIFYFLTFIDDLARKFGFTFSNTNLRLLPGSRNSRLK